MISMISDTIQAMEFPMAEKFLQLQPYLEQKIIGHRGASIMAPENTIASFSIAAKHVNFVEFDIQLTKDNVWVVIHDDTLDRTTNGQGNVSDFDLANLLNLDAGSWFSNEFKGEKIPTLDEVLEYLAKNNIAANIEIKSNLNLQEPMLQDLANIINKHQKENNLNALISSFEPKYLILARKVMPDIPIGYLIDKPTKNTIKEVIDNSYNTINCSQKHFDINIHNEILNHNIPILYYTVNDKEQAKYLLELGASAVFSDVPTLLD